MDAIVKGCVIEHAMLATDQYGDEVLYAGWNPQLAQADVNNVAPIDKHIDLPADLAEVDVDTFLQKMYEYQR